MENTLYYAENCLDTIPFKKRLEELNINYKEVEIMSSLKNLKEFLFIRDTYKEFADFRGKMTIGIPVLVISKEDCILNIRDLERVR